MTILERLNELKALADAATPGPWRIHLRDPFSIDFEVGVQSKNGGTLFRSTSYGKMSDDGWFIIGARTAMPQLIEALSFSLNRMHAYAKIAGVQEVMEEDLERIADILDVGR